MTNPKLITDRDFRIHLQNTNGKLTDGDLITILDYCLVEQCGWTKGQYSTSTITSYQPNLPFGTFILRDDGSDLNNNFKNTNADAYAFFTGVESVTDLVTLDFVNKFPREDQESGGLAIRKAMNWSFIGNDTCFYFIMYQKSPGFYYNSTFDNIYNDKNIVGYMSFGDFKSKRNSIYDVIIQGNTAQYYGNNAQLGKCVSLDQPDAFVEGLYLANSGGVFGKKIGLMFDFGSNHPSLHNYGFADKKLLMTPFRVICDNQIIGTMRGMYGSRNALSYRNNSIGIFSNENPVFSISNKEYTAFADSQNYKSGVIFNINNWS